VLERRFTKSSEITQKAITPFKIIQGHPFWYQSEYDFLLVINTNLAPISHRFRDIAFDRSNIAIFGYPSCVNPPPPTEGFPWEKMRKILYPDVNGWPKYQMA